MGRREEWNLLNFVAEFTLLQIGVVKMGEILKCENKRERKSWEQRM